MPFEHDMGDSTPKNNREQTETFKPIGDLARDLLRKSVEAMNDGQFELAETYHEQFIAASVPSRGGDK